MFIAIVDVQNNRVAKFAEFATQAEADAHVGQYGGFVFDNVNDWAIENLYVDVGNVVTNQPPVPDYDAIDTGKIAAILTDTGVLRGVSLLLLKRSNQIATKVNGVMTAIEGANSLAEIKTAIAALGALPIYSQQDFVDAIKQEMR